MKTLVLTITFGSLFFPGIAQETVLQTEISSKRTDYFYQESEVKGKGVVYTEMVINASPEKVRARFLEFEKWPEWNAVIPKIEIESGDLNDLSSEPTLDLTLDFGRKNDPKQAPVFPMVTENNAEVFNWGFKKAILKAEHVFIFESIDNGAGTHFVHYERMWGFMRALVLTNKTKVNMATRYNEMNKALKSVCE